MKTEMGDIKKLPKWAQKYIENIARERADAIRKLNEFVDCQTKDKFYTSDYVCTGETQGPSEKIRHIQGDVIRCSHDGIDLSVYAHKRGKIEIQYSASGSIIGGIALTPLSYQRIELTALQNKTE